MTNGRKPVANTGAKLIEKAARSSTANAPCPLNAAHGASVIRHRVLGKDTTVGKKGRPAVSAGKLGRIVHANDLNLTKDEAQRGAQQLGKLLHFLRGVRLATKDPAV